MNIGLIFAGGAGTRMNVKTKPKQFLKVEGKEIIVHTLDVFQKHKEIDSIIVVIIEPWIEYLNNLIKTYSLDKVVSVIPGGKTAQESQYFGLKEIKKMYPEKEDINVLLHDGVRPLVSHKTISKNIKMVKEKGTAITVTPAIETVIQTENNAVKNILDRSMCKLAKAPQSFKFKDIYSSHEKAISENNKSFIDSASLMTHYGYELFTVEGSTDNIKITTPADFFVFKAILESRRVHEVFG